MTHYMTKIQRAGRLLDAVDANDRTLGDAYDSEWYRRASDILNGLRLDGTVASWNERDNGAAILLYMQTCNRHDRILDAIASRVEREADFARTECSD